MSRIRVFLLDDHEIVRRGVASVLTPEKDLDVVGEAGTVRSGVAGILQTRPDVALVDVRLPDGTGLEVARAVAVHRLPTRVMVLTSQQSESTLRDAFAAGVTGYAFKDIRSASLLRGIRSVAAGGTYIGPSVTGHLMDSVRREPAAEPEVLGRLAPRERSILQLIGDGLTNRQIAERLYLSEKTIKNNVTAILGKLGVASRTQAAVLVSRLEG